MIKTILKWVEKNIYSKIIFNDYRVIFKDIERGSSVLDVGCGENSFLKHHNKEYVLYGLDIS